MACDGLGVDPKNCLYVGDGYSGELAGASSLGMTALLLHVPDEPSSSEHPGEKATWTGGRIASLAEVLKHLAIE
jgi:putative hydrolase of the HAD superfamily